MFLLLSVSLFSQEWTTDELLVLENFGLSKDDHRGLIFNPMGEEGCLLSYPNPNDALISFFTTTIKRDITTYCIETSEGINYYEIMDIHQLVQIYLTLNQ